MCEEQPVVRVPRRHKTAVVIHPRNRVDAALAAKKAKGGTTNLTEAELKALPQMWVQTSSRSTVDGQDLTDAQPGFDKNNRPVVTFRFNQKGALRFGNLTKDNVNKPFAIVLDGVVQSAPVINEPSSVVQARSPKFYDGGNRKPLDCSQVRRFACQAQYR